jgi:hypothetical protein
LTEFRQIRSNDYKCMQCAAPCVCFVAAQIKKKYDQSYSKVSE